jgi:hypothetical protein
VPYSIRYGFSQHFSVSAAQAFDWCTDYLPTDHALIGIDGAERTVTKVADDVLIVKDSFSTKSGQIEKEKLVHLYPERLAWTSTHISGPNIHSQFTYHITQQDNGSRLDFAALHIEHKENLTEKELAALTMELRDGDAELWRCFAETMKKELVK